ncbi:MAG: DUF2498 family protein [Plesiomonas sp.]|uniref:DUF2498 family protein n=1 Tax=Plesiomonas sp. TaxID=2486279 RepID=UPI003F32BC48
MTDNKQPIKRTDLLKIANALIIEHDDFIEGMSVDSVEQKNGVLIFRGNYFLDENGLPTGQSTLAFNIFKLLAQALSKQYQLID